MRLEAHILSLCRSRRTPPPVVVCRHAHQAAWLERRLARASAATGGPPAPACVSVQGWCADVMARLTGAPWRAAEPLEEALLVRRILGELGREGVAAARPDHLGLLHDLLALLGWVLASEASGDELVRALAGGAGSAPAASGELPAGGPALEEAAALAGGAAYEGGAAEFARLFARVWQRYAQETLRRRWVSAGGAAVECLSLLGKAGDRPLPPARAIWLPSLPAGSAEARLIGHLRARGSAVAPVRQAALEAPPAGARAFAALLRALDPAATAGPATAPAPADPQAPPAGIRWQRLRSEADEAAWIAGEAWELIARGVAPAELLVVCAEPARHAPLLADALARLGLPCGLQAGVLPGAPAWRLLAALRDLGRAPDPPAAGEAWRRLAELRAFGLGEEALGRLRRAPPARVEAHLLAESLALPAAGAERALAVQHGLRGLCGLDAPGGPGAASGLRAAERAVPTLLRLIEGAAALLPASPDAPPAWGEPARLARMYDDICADWSVAERRDDLLGWIERAPAAFDPPPESVPGAAIQVATPEQAAGLRAHTVFLPSLVDGVWPRPMPASPYGPRRALLRRIAGLSGAPAPWAERLGEHTAREGARLAGLLGIAEHEAVLTTSLRLNDRHVEPSPFFELLERTWPAAAAGEGPARLRSWGGWAAALLEAHAQARLPREALERAAARAGLHRLAEEPLAVTAPEEPVRTGEPPELSARAVRTFQTCPRRFFYRHLLGLPEPIRPAPGLALAVNAALRLGRFPAGAPALPREAERFLRGWSERAGAPGGGFGPVFADVLAGFADYRAQQPRPGHPETLRFEREGFPFRVDVDWHEADPDALLDQRSGRLLSAEQVRARYFGLRPRKPTDAEDLELFLYVVGSEAALGRTPDEVGLIAVGAEDPARPGARAYARVTVPRAEFERARPALERQLAGLLGRLRGGAFPAQPRAGRDCETCAYRLVCDRDRPAAFRRQDDPEPPAAPEEEG